MPVASHPGASAAAPPRLRARRLEWLPDPERAFVHLYGASRNAFWLDSSAAGGERGRFSFMGDDGGALGAVVTYDVADGLVRVDRGGEVEHRRESIFEHLDREQRPRGAVDVDLPFEFDTGFAGYLGYELKADCDSGPGAGRGRDTHRAGTPDAAFVRPERLIAFDHAQGHTYLLGPEAWIEEVASRLTALPPVPKARLTAGVKLSSRRPPERYLEDIAACQRYLRAGHSYEICLTNRLLGETEAEPLDLYSALRRANPAPFAAYLRFGELAVLSSSPERFLAVDGEGRAEARPIKGTSRRGATAAADARLAAALAADAKSRAENVTIVDLLRNDLGRVCATGSVEVPELMRVETYETVHQLVSSVRGRLRDGVGAAAASRACFPPGSMTGAPKLRTMEILEELEAEARGVYSGAIGWFGRGGGCDLSVAIRTIVLDRGAVSIGAGGAIVVDSDPEAELAEMLLKAEAPAAALGSGTSISSAVPAPPAPIRPRQPTPTPTPIPS